MSQAVLEPDAAASRGMDLLRFATAGSVDDGKSTLIGRLLFDTKTIFEDQLESVEAVSAARGDDEPVFHATVRYRTVGDMSCTGAVESAAATIEEVITEIAATRITERGQTRADDRTSEAAMEDRKKEGYF